MAANTRTAPATRRGARSAPATTEPKSTQVDTVTGETQAKPDAEAKHPYAYLMDKEPTQLHLNYQAWLKETTGVELDLKTIQVVCVTRMAFQRSEANQKELQSRKQAWAKQQADRKKAAAAKKVEQLKKLAKEQGLDLAKLLASA
jgi:hypothetical protein